MLTTDEKEKLIQDHPESKVLIKQIMGSKEFINGIIRWCLWIEDKDADLANSILPIKDRLSKIKQYRINGSERGKMGIDTPHKFERTLTCKNTQIIIPRVSSQRRAYIPIGYLNKNVIISDAAQVIYDAEPYVFSIISSRMHMTWVRATAGRLKSDYRYSSGVCYNSFPFVNINESNKNKMVDLALNIISTREKYPDRTPAILYDPDKMPSDLQATHTANDIFIESLYKKSIFNNDTERLECLFALYNKMTGIQDA